METTEILSANKGDKMNFFQKKKKAVESLSRVVARFALSKNIKKLSKKDLEMIVDGYKFYFIDVPIRRREKSGSRK